MRALGRLSALAFVLAAGCGAAVDPTAVSERVELFALAESVVAPDTHIVQIVRESDTTRILGSMSHWSRDSVRVLVPASEVSFFLPELKQRLLDAVASGGVEVGTGERRGNVWRLDYGTPEIEGSIELHVSGQGIDGVVISLDLEERG